MKNWQREGCRLAGPRLGNAQQVGSGHHDGDRLRLNRRRRRVFQLPKCLEDWLGETEFGKLCH